MTALLVRARVPALPSWFVLALLFSISLHILILMQLRIQTTPAPKRSSERIVLQQPPAQVLPAQPETIESMPPQPVLTLPEVLGGDAPAEPIPAPDVVAPTPALPQETTTNASPEATAVQRPLDLNELRTKMKAQIRSQPPSAADSAALQGANAESVWRDNGGYALPGSVNPDNLFTDRMHGITGLSGTKRVEKFKDVNGFDQQIVELKDGTRLCGERQPPPNFEPFAHSIFLWRKC